MSEVRAREKLVHVRVSDDEKRAIEYNATVFGFKRIAPYLLAVSKGVPLKIYDFKVRERHTKLFGYVTLYTNYLTTMIKDANEYIPREALQIHQLIEDIYRLENKLIRTVRDICRRE